MVERISFASKLSTGPHVAWAAPTGTVSDMSAVPPPTDHLAPTSPVSGPHPMPEPVPLQCRDLVFAALAVLLVAAPLVAVALLVVHPVLVRAGRRGTVTRGPRGRLEVRVGPSMWAPR